MRSSEEGPSSTGADSGYEERTSVRYTGASQCPVQDQPNDELSKRSTCAETRTNTQSGKAAKTQEVDHHHEIGHTAQTLSGY